MLSNKTWSNRTVSVVITIRIALIASRISAMLFVFAYDEERLYSEIFRRLIKVYSDA